MITIKLNEAKLFGTGGLFEGTDRKKAVLHVGTGKQEQYIPTQDAYDINQLRNKDYGNSMLIDVNGVSFSDITLEKVMSVSVLFSSFGLQILEYNDQELIQVFQDQNPTPLTTTQLKDYTAP